MSEGIFSNVKTHLKDTWENTLTLDVNSKDSGQTTVSTDLVFYQGCHISFNGLLRNTYLCM